MSAITHEKVVVMERLFILLLCLTTLTDCEKIVGYWREPIDSPVAEGATVEYNVFLDAHWATCIWFFEHHGQHDEVCRQYAGKIEGDPVQCDNSNQDYLNGGHFKENVCTLVIQNVNQTLSGNWTVSVAFHEFENVTKSTMDYFLETTRRAVVEIVNGTNNIIDEIETVVGEEVSVNCQAESGIPVSNGFHWTINNEAVDDEWSPWKPCYSNLIIFQNGSLVRQTIRLHPQNIGEVTLTCSPIQSLYQGPAHQKSTNVKISVVDKNTHTIGGLSRGWFIGILVIAGGLLLFGVILVVCCCVGCYKKQSKSKVTYVQADKLLTSSASQMALPTTRVQHSNPAIISHGRVVNPLSYDYTKQVAIGASDLRPNASYDLRTTQLMNNNHHPEPRKRSFKDPVYAKPTSSGKTESTDANTMRSVIWNLSEDEDDISTMARIDNKSISATNSFDDRRNKNISAFTVYPQKRDTLV